MPSIQKLLGCRAAVSAVLFFLFGCALLYLAGCAGTASFAPTPAGAVVGRANEYDYSPSVIQVGHVQQFWWCGEGINPNSPGPLTDTIQYESIDLVTGQRNGPLTVLGGTPGAWDSLYTCNPTVVQGAFANPLGDGVTYTYALYYEATQVDGPPNSIGVAFSNDGMHWKKYPSPVIPSVNPNFAGPSQPAAVNMDGKQAVWLFYEDDEPPLPQDTHIEMTSPDGVHFTRAGILTAKGITIPTNLDSWGTIAFNPPDKSWYATFNQTTRSLSMTGNVEERGSWGFQLYRISQDDLLVGNTGWQLLKNVDTNSTGYVTLFDAGLARDAYGNLYQEDSTGTLQIFPSFANVRPPWNASPAAATTPTTPGTWDIGMYTWSPADPPQGELDRYNNGIAHLVTTGWIDPTGGFSVEKKLGHLYQYPQGGATVPLYGCKNGTMDAFLSLDMACEGQRIMGINGYLYAQPVAGLTLTPLYRCSTATDHFASSDPKCEGSHTDELLGYIVPE